MLEFTRYSILMMRSAFSIVPSTKYVSKRAVLFASCRETAYTHTRAHCTSFRLNALQHHSAGGSLGTHPASCLLQTHLVDVRVPVCDLQHFHTHIVQGDAACSG